jgi:hypothetical protein
MAASEIRSKFLKYTPFRSRIVEVEVPCEDGSVETLRVKIRQPDVSERQSMFADAKISRDGSVNAEQSRIGALSIIHCVRDPDTDEPVFSAADLDTLLHLPTGSWFDKLSGKVMEVLSEAQDLAKK